MIEQTKTLHPAEYLLQTGSIPSAWCPGCGIGTVVNTFIQAVKKSNIDLNEICLVSGVGCTGKVAYHVKFDSFQTIYRNPIKCALQLKEKNPKSHVVVFMNNTDFMTSDAEDFIGSGRKGTNLLVVYFNNFMYDVLIGEKGLAKTPFIGVAADNSIESPFNIPRLAKSCGAGYIARWTPLHVRRLTNSMAEALQKPGFSVIEVVSPCLMYYASNGIIDKSLDRVGFFSRKSIIKNDEPMEKLMIRSNEKFIIGKFVDDK